MTWHNQVVILKQQLQQLAAVIGSGLIQAIKPFVIQMNNALSGLIKFAQNVVNALGKIFGWEMEVNTKGLKIDDEDLENLENIDTSGLQDTADASDKAATAVKNLKDQLQGFDKLNVLRTQEKNPSTGTNNNNKDNGNGNGSNAGAGVSGGEALAALKKTKSLFESNIDNLFDLGRYISDTLKKSLASIKWNEIYAKARNFGKGLAEFLNGLITPGLFMQIGRTLAGVLNTAFHFLDSFGQTFDWSNFGKSIAAGINGFFRNIDWKTIFSTAKTWGQGIATALNSFIKDTDFKLVGQSIANAIKTGVLYFLSLGSTIKWKDLGNALADTINGAIKNFPAEELAETINVWVQGIYDALMTAVSHTNWGDVMDKIADFLDTIDLKTIKILLGAVLLVKGAGFAVTVSAEILNAIKTQLITSLVNFFTGGLTLKQILINIENLAFALPGTPVFDVLATDILERIWKAIRDNAPKSWNSWYDEFDKFIKETVIGGFFQMLEDSFKWENTKEQWDRMKEDFKQGGIYIVRGIGEGITAGLEFLAEPIIMLQQNIFKYFCDVFGISSPAETMKPIGQYIIEGIIEGFKIPDLSGAIETIKTKIFNFVTDAKDKFDDMKTKIGEKVTGISTDMKTKWETIKANTSSTWETIKGKVSKLASEAWENTSDVWDKLESGTSRIWGNIKDTASDVWGDIKDAISDKIEDARDAVDDAIDAIKDAFDFNWELPDLKLPSISIDGEFSLNPPSAPSFHLRWHRKAYDNPFMFTKPTVVPTMDGFGDGNGGEMVYGHANLMNDIREASGSSEMTAIGNRQLALLQRQNSILTAILEKEFGISEDAVFNAVRNKSADYTMRTGRGAFEF